MRLFTQLALTVCTAILFLLLLLSLLFSGRISFAASIVLVIILAAVLFFFSYHTIIKPLAELKKAALNIRDGNLDFTLESDSGSEIGELVRSFEEMRVRLLESENSRISIDNDTRELVRNIAHDLKTPITTIRGYAEGLLDGVADSPEKQEKYIRTIQNKAEDMTKLIDELSFYSKVDSNRIPYAFRKLCARDFFDECADDLQAELSGKNIRFTYRQDVAQDVRILADPEQLKKVINNIISNSEKYMDKSPGLIELSLSDKGDFVQCDIRDNGKGVSARDLSKIYDRFYRTDQSRNSLEGGSGIGLSIVKKIIEDHGGSIWASGSLGEGLTQHFILRKIYG